MRVQRLGRRIESGRVSDGSVRTQESASALLLCVHILVPMPLQGIRGDGEDIFVGAKFM